MPPTTAEVAGQTIDLLLLAREICGRYHQEFPDERTRYGPAAEAWCVHDMQHLLNWAAGEVNGHLDMIPQVEWLAAVLDVRGFPLDRLARGLSICADVVSSEVGGRRGSELAEVLARSAEHVRRETVLTEPQLTPGVH